MKRSELLAGLVLNEQGRAVFEGTGRQVPIHMRQRAGRLAPYYLIEGRYLRAELVQDALRFKAPNILDAPLPRVTLRPIRVSPRDIAVWHMRKDGATYQAIGDRYNMSRQRVYQVIKRLAAYTET